MGFEYLTEMWRSDIEHLDHVKRGLGEVFDQVEKADQKGFDSPVMTDMMQEIFGLLKSDITPKEQSRFAALERAAMAIAAHIDTQNQIYRPEFHNRGHFLFVQLAGRLIDRLNQNLMRQLGRDLKLPVLSPADLACSAAIDLLHDLDHTGGTNTIEGVYQPMQLENRALEHALPILQNQGVGPEDIALITTAVRASDPALPKEIMQQAYAWHFTFCNQAPVNVAIYDDKFSNYDPQTRQQLTELANNLYGDEKAAFLAARLGDADLFASFGMDEARSRLETQKLNREFLQNGAGILCDPQGEPQGRLYALLKILGGKLSLFSGAFEVGFTTPGAQLLGGENARLFQKNAQEMLGLEGCSKIYQAASVPMPV